MATAIEPPPRRRFIDTADWRAKASEFGIDVIGLDDAAVRERVIAEGRRRFQEENGAAIAFWKRYVEKNGLPLAKYRLF